MEVEEMPPPCSPSLKRTREDKEDAENPTKKCAGRNRTDRNVPKARSLSVLGSPKQTAEHLLKAQSLPPHLLDLHPPLPPPPLPVQYLLLLTPSLLPHPTMPGKRKRRKGFSLTQKIAAE